MAGWYSFKIISASMSFVGAANEEEIQRDKRRYLIIEFDGKLEFGGGILVFIGSHSR
jgi:hypothetical protein